jgi:hypothetical protein
VNRAGDPSDAQAVLRHLDPAAPRCSHRSLSYDGVPHPQVQVSTLDQHVVVTRVPNVPASRCFWMRALRQRRWLPTRPISSRRFARVEARQCA